MEVFARHQTSKKVSLLKLPLERILEKEKRDHLAILRTYGKGKLSHDKIC